MNPKTFIFIGRSGCGKGTQVRLLIEYLKKNYPKPLFYLESGERFREFISSSSHTASLSKEIMDKGELQPAFLAIHIWSHLMIEQMDTEKHLIIDGTPRLLDEAKILDGALKFYQREKPNIIYLNVSRAWSQERLLGRGRNDDKNIKEINKRLDWFESEVLSVIEFYQNNSDYNFCEINGEQTIENVQKEILEKLS